VEALRVLARHPAAHRFLATRRVRQFVSDDPPADAARTIEGMPRDSSGNLGAAAGARVGLQAAWQPRTKLRTPQDFVIVGARALGLDIRAIPDLPPILTGLGQPLRAAPAPNGWSDSASDWAGPEAMMRRVAKGLLATHLGLSPPALEQVFPGRSGAAPMKGCCAPDPAGSDGEELRR
jgi:uncharacterized protein (DUF1800 family)